MPDHLFQARHLFRRTALLWLVLFVFVGVGGVPGPGGGSLDRLRALYRRADSLYHLENSTHATDSLALAGFSAVITGLQGLPGHGDQDTLLAGAFLRKGVLLDAAYDYAGAKACYSGALDHDRQVDSLTFVAKLYIGVVYYNTSHFDSANYFLLNAQALVNRFKDWDDEVRVYNMLGVLYYDNGNYREGKNYFDKALELVKGRKSLDTAFARGLETNIATSFSRLGQYQEALNIYRRLAGYQPLANYVNMNMGQAFVGLEDYTAALVCFHRVDARKLPGVLNELAYTQERLHRPDSCSFYLQKLVTAVKEGPGKIYAADQGINAQYMALWLSDQGRFEEALVSLQRAIILFSRNFSNTDIYSNPANFTGTFAYYRLFDALVEKAALFRQLYKSKSERKYLEASFAAYTTALSLLRHIEKSYATDEAKLFLKKKSGPVHAGALAVSLQLYELSHDQGYLEQAFLISEKSKASVITANLEEKAFTGLAGAQQQLQQQVNDCKFNIARLNIKSETVTDSIELADIARERESREVELSRLEQSLEQDGGYYQLKYGDASPGIHDLQQQLESGQALISVYAADSALHVFVVTKKGFNYRRIDGLTGLEADVTSWLQALKSTGNGHRFKGDVVGSRLYTQLIRPVQDMAGGEEEWIIIPDGFLHLLPWESLPADAGGEHRLVETNTISYRWSSRLLKAGAQVGTGILSFAPFASQGGEGGFARLPASAEEIAGLKGMQYVDNKATKAQFLEAANRYPIVHLATHAVSSTDNAAASYIAFFPVKHSPIEDRLYLEELYGLNLRDTRLVIISACETGEGEVVAQEGVMSLARAFAYAGCGSTINSLWKADDQATSFILRRFYVHLQAGETKARALRDAKLDYLKSDAIDKSPAYWAHLVLTGDGGPVYGKGFWSWGWLLGPLLVVILGIVVWRKRGFKKRGNIRG
jgi:CHAT domain-containing protein/tetratricopeptide (TPR) repeat protein